MLRYMILSALRHETRHCSHSAFQLCGVVDSVQDFLPMEVHVQNKLSLLGGSIKHRSLPASLVSCISSWWL